MKITITITKVGPYAYDVTKTGSCVDLHIQRWGQRGEYSWLCDMFNSRIRDPNKAHIGDTFTVGTNREHPDWPVVLNELYYQLEPKPKKGKKHV